jgi:hypothetical protein
LTVNDIKHVSIDAYKYLLKKIGAMQWLAFSGIEQNWMLCERNVLFQIGG